MIGSTVALEPTHPLLGPTEIFPTAPYITMLSLGLARDSMPRLDSYNKGVILATYRYLFFDVHH